MAKKNKENLLASFGGETIDLAKFNLKSDKEQYKEIEQLLKKIYADKVEVNKKLVNKVLKLTYNPKDDYTYLPHGLKVSKEKLDLKFSPSKRKIGIGLILFGILLLLFALIGSTYLGITYIQIANLNKDIDKDGIADINIDINKDRKADINVDTDNDNKPDFNIDYKGNRKSIFNIDSNNDGIADSNLVNDASTEEKRQTCTINCDINGDGWPDLNLDLDGDGKPDVDIDTDNDGVADLNLDINGDSIPDIMIDTDGDGQCDVNCIQTEYNGINTGTSQSTGNNATDTGSSNLIIKFDDGLTVNVNNLVPDDQPLLENETLPKAYKTFTIENLSDFSLTYSMKIKVNYNTFTTSNFQYEMTSTNGGARFDYTIVPTVDTYIARNVLIPARTIQKYTINFNLVGLNRPQNEDQNKSFSALIEVETP